MTEINPFDPPDSSVNTDSLLVNENIGTGTSRDKMAATYVNPFAAAQRLSVQERSHLFRGDSFIRRLCSAIPTKAATRGWYCKVADDDDDKIGDEIEQYRKQVATNSDVDISVDGRRFSSIEDLFKVAQTFANYQDGCLLVLNIDDGRPPDQPVDHKKIKRIAGIEVVLRRYCRVVLEDAPNPLDPIHYEIISLRRGMSPLNNPSDRLSGFTSSSQEKRGGVKVHCSRVIRFDGSDPLDDEFVIANDGWYACPIDLIWDYFQRWRSGLDSIGGTIGDGSIFVYKLKGLRNLIASGKQSLISQRLNILTTNVSTNGGVALDMNDETIEYASRNYGGVADILDAFRGIMVGATGLPHTVVLGDSPSGLGASGESEQQQLQELVTEQTYKWRSGIERLYRLMFLSKEGPTKGKIPEDWEVVFRPLKEQDEAERLNNLGAFTNAQATAIGSGYLTAEEARASFDGDVEFNFKLDNEAWKKQKEEEKAQEQSQFGGGQFGEPEGAFPEEEDPLEAQAPPPEEEVQQDSRMDSSLDMEWTIVAEVPDYQAAAWEAGTNHFLIMDSDYAQDYIARTAEELERMDKGIADRHGLTKKKIKGTDGVIRTYWVKKGGLEAPRRKYFGGKSSVPTREKYITGKNDNTEKLLAIGAGAALVGGTIGLMAWEKKREKELSDFDAFRREAAERAVAATPPVAPPAEPPTASAAPPAPTAPPAPPAPTAPKTTRKTKPSGTKTKPPVSESEAPASPKSSPWPPSGPTREADLPVPPGPSSPEALADPTDRSNWKQVIPKSGRAGSDKVEGIMTQDPENSMNLAYAIGDRKFRLEAKPGGGSDQTTVRGGSWRGADEDKLAIGTWKGGLHAAATAIDKWHKENPQSESPASPKPPAPPPSPPPVPLPPPIGGGDSPKPSPSGAPDSPPSGGSKARAVVLPGPSAVEPPAPEPLITADLTLTKQKTEAPDPLVTEPATSKPQPTLNLELIKQNAEELISYDGPHVMIAYGEELTNMVYVNPRSEIFGKKLDERDRQAQFHFGARRIRHYISPGEWGVIKSDGNYYQVSSAEEDPLRITEGEVRTGAAVGFRLQ